MRTVTSKINAYLTNEWVTIDQLFNDEAEQVLNRLCFYSHNCAPNTWVHVGTAEITLTLNKPDDLIASKVESLKADLQKTQADAEVRCNQLREKINNLLAIEFKPEAA